MFKKLSKKEYKYRLKIINYLNLNKEKQRILDKQVEYTYKELFYNPSEAMRILFEYSVPKAFQDLSREASKATIAIQHFAEVIKNVF
jgi:hypothetical protein